MYGDPFSRLSGNIFRRTSSLFRGFLEFQKHGLALFKFAAALYLFQKNVGELMICVGPSMLPTLSAEGDVVVLEHFTPYYRDLCRADVVVAVSPQNPRMSVCKRVAAVSGERVPVSDSLAETIRQCRPELIQTGAHGSSVQIPRGHVWLEGDNPANSTDSRQYGPVPISLVRGRVVYRILPLNSAGWIPQQPKYSNENCDKT
jgi:signal peptidase I